jgi:hypothetical protein
MTRTNSSSVDADTLRRWIDDGIEMSVVREKLSHFELEEASIDCTIREFKKMKHGRR